MRTSPRLRTNRVRQLRQNGGFSTAKVAKATDTPPEVCTRVGNRPGNAGSRLWSIPTTSGTTTDLDSAAALKELDRGLRSSVRGSVGERGNCVAPAALQR